MKKKKEIARTVKHKLVLNLEQESKLLEIMQTYQTEKNFFSDMLNSYNWNSGINFLQGFSYIDIESSLIKQKYQPKNPLLPARAWKLALREAFNLHERTFCSQFHHYTSFKSETGQKLKLNTLSDAEKHVLNHIFFSWKSFITFAKIVFDYKFKRKSLPKKALYYENFKIYMETVFLVKAKIEKSKRQEYEFYKFSNRLINKLVYITKKIFQTKQVLTQINSTIRLDSDCYKLYQDKNGNNYLDVICLDKSKRIKKIKLMGYKGSLPNKKNFSSSLLLSFNRNDMSFYIHLSFKAKSSKSFKSKSFKNNNISELVEENSLGMDFGITEFGTLSNGNVVGAKQGEILSKINHKSEQLLAKIQENSLKSWFGVEKINKEGKRNHSNNCFNHNFRKQNINIEYRQQQDKVNRRLENLKYQQVKELIDYCQLNNITQLILENLNFKQLQQGKNKHLKALNQNINLIKNCFSLLEKQIEKNNLNISLSYVNPAYTSQTCPDCFFVDRENRKREEFRCQYCGLIPQQDERYKPVFLANPKLSGADFIAALNIKAFHFHETLKGNLYLKKDEVKKKILEVHESKKENFCKA